MPGKRSSKIAYMSFSMAGSYTLGIRDLERENSRHVVIHAANVAGECSGIFVAFDGQDVLRSSLDDDRRLEAATATPGPIVAKVIPGGRVRCARVSDRRADVQENLRGIHVSNLYKMLSARADRRTDEV